MNACQHKHTKYQPTDEEWRCPQCGATAQEGFIVYESINDMDNIECELLHPEDFLFCEKCNLETSGKAFAAFVVKKNSLVICPTCKGKGMVNKDSSTAHAAEVERLTAERDALDTALDQANADGEERRKEVVYWRSAFVKAGAERDAAVARAERAEACLRDAASKLSQVKEYLEDYFEGDRDHRYLGIQCIIEIGVKRITNMLADAVPSSPPADVNKMEGERCDTCQYESDTCDRAECPAWGKSEEAKARIIIDEANRPLTDEECAIVDAGYERGKRILAEVKAEERERRLAEALDAIISNIEDRLDQPHGDDHVNLTLEHLADIARAALAEIEGK